MIQKKRNINRDNTFIFQFEPPQSQILTLGRFKLKYKCIVADTDSGEVQIEISTATIHLYFNLNLPRVSICDVRIRDRVWL